MQQCALYSQVAFDTNARARCCYSHVRFDSCIAREIRFAILGRQRSLTDYRMAACSILLKLHVRNNPRFLKNGAAAHACCIAARRIFVDVRRIAMWASSSHSAALVGRVV